MIAKKIFYRGLVQGVGFRYTARRISAQHAVSGFVRNLADGRVEIFVQGESGVVGRFLGEIQDALGGHISGAEETAAVTDSRYPGFVVEH